MKSTYEEEIIRDEMQELAKESDIENFRTLVKASLQAARLKSASRGKIILFRGSLLSVAALMLLFFLVYHPVEKYRIHQYIGESGESAVIPVQNYKNFVRGTISGSASSSTVPVRFVADPHFSGHYFVRKSVLYLPSALKEGKLFRRITTEGQMEYFLTVEILQETFHLSFTNENRILALEKAGLKMK